MNHQISASSLISLNHPALLWRSGSQDAVAIGVLPPQAAQKQSLCLATSLELAQSALNQGASILIVSNEVSGQLFSIPTGTALFTTRNLQ